MTFIEIYDIIKHTITHNKHIINLIFSFIYFDICKVKDCYNLIDDLPVKPKKCRLHACPCYYNPINYSIFYDRNKIICIQCGRNIYHICSICHRSLVTQCKCYLNDM